MTDTLVLVQQAMCCPDGCKKATNLDRRCYSDVNAYRARAALQTLSPPSAAVERAVALASCHQEYCDKYCGKSLDKPCLTRARRTVDALVTAVLGEKGNG